MAAERLQKILARSGKASRRAAEQLILAGRVRVNGRIVTELGTRADPHYDRIEVDGKRLVSEKPVYYLLNKPRAVVTTLRDPEGRQTIADILKGIRERVFPVGRLDYHTSGALLVTNDGEMAQALLHPRKGVPKTYIAKFQGLLELKQLNALRQGVKLGRERTSTSRRGRTSTSGRGRTSTSDRGPTSDTSGKAELFVLREERGNTWLQITLTEGKNRQVHRMGEAIGHRVLRLSRQSFAGLTIEGLRQGQYRPLTTRELEKIKRDYVTPFRRSEPSTAKAKTSPTKPKPPSKKPKRAKTRKAKTSPPKPKPPSKKAKRTRPKTSPAKPKPPAKKAKRAKPKTSPAKPKSLSKKAKTAKSGRGKT